MIAALTMYDMPHLRGATDRLWQGIRSALGDGPETLTRGADPWGIWQAETLLLAQTCGLPFRARLHDRVTLVGTPDYGVAGCAPGFYRSVIVVREGDGIADPRALDGRRMAYNEALSQSGWAAPQRWMRAEGLAPGAWLCTGAHAASARAVAEGRADFAALDAVTYTLLQEAGEVSGLRVLARTEPTPGLPLITARGRDPRPLFEAVSEAIAALAPEDARALHLKGLVAIDKARYMALPLPEPPPDN